MFWELFLISCYSEAEKAPGEAKKIFYTMFCLFANEKNGTVWESRHDGTEYEQIFLLVLMTNPAELLSPAWYSIILAILYSVPGERLFTVAVVPVTDWLSTSTPAPAMRTKWLS